jgi:hypothetical protein
MSVEEAILKGVKMARRCSCPSIGRYQPFDAVDPSTWYEEAIEPLPMTSNRVYLYVTEEPDEKKVVQSENENGNSKAEFNHCQQNSNTKQVVRDNKQRKNGDEEGRDNLENKSMKSPWLDDTNKPETIVKSRSCNRRSSCSMVQTFAAEDRAKITKKFRSPDNGSRLAAKVDYQEYEIKNNLDDKRQELENQDATKINRKYQGRLSSPTESQFPSHVDHLDTKRSVPVNHRVEEVVKEDQITRTDVNSIQMTRSKSSSRSTQDNKREIAIHSNHSKSNDVMSAPSILKSREVQHRLKPSKSRSPRQNKSRLTQSDADNKRAMKHRTSDSRSENRHDELHHRSKLISKMSNQDVSALCQKTMKHRVQRRASTSMITDTEILQLLEEENEARKQRDIEGYYTNEECFKRESQRRKSLTYNTNRIMPPVA